MSDNGKLLRKDLEEVKKPFISAPTYEQFRNAVEVAIPGLAVLYVALAGFWDLPKPTEVAGSLSAIALFLGLFIKVNRSRNDKVEAVKADIAEQKKADAQVGEIILGTGDETTMGLATLRLDKEPTEFADQDEIRLKVLNVDLPSKE